MGEKKTKMVRWIIEDWLSSTSISTNSQNSQANLTLYHPTCPDTDSQSGKNEYVHLHSPKIELLSKKQMYVSQKYTIVLYLSSK